MHLSGPGSDLQLKLPIGAPLSQLASVAPHPHVKGWVGSSFSFRQVNPDAHTRPHIPQLLVASRGVSHPSSGLPLQSAKPVAQVGVQPPPVHAVVPFPLVQALLHVPQWVVVVTLVSQPSAGLALQSAKPAGHVRPHAPLVQVACPVGPGQALPHVPQSLGSFAVSVSHPLLAMPSQSAKPVSQVVVQAPFPSQPGVWCADEAHAPHAAASQPKAGLLVEAQTPAQSLVPVGQEPPVPELDDATCPVLTEVPPAAPPEVTAPPAPPVLPLLAVVETPLTPPSPAVWRPHAPTHARLPPSTKGNAEIERFTRGS